MVVTKLRPAQDCSLLYRCLDRLSKVLLNVMD